MVLSIDAVQDKLAQTRACIVSNVQNTECFLRKILILNDAVAELHVKTDLRRVFD